MNANLSLGLHTVQTSKSLNQSMTSKRVAVQKSNFSFDDRLKLFPVVNITVDINMFNGGSQKQYYRQKYYLLNLKIANLANSQSSTIESKVASSSSVITGYCAQKEKFTCWLLPKRVLLRKPTGRVCIGTTCYKQGVGVGL